MTESSQGEPIRAEAAAPPPRKAFSEGDVLRENFAVAELDTEAMVFVSLQPEENRRTIRIVEPRPNGKWLVETLTSVTGRPVRSAVKLRLSQRTLEERYVAA
jgi:hypothetical protein